MNRFILLLIVLVSCQFSFAETGYKKGTGLNVRVHNGDIYTSWKPPKFWFTLKSVASAGTCKTWNGSVLFSMDSDMAYSMILAAQMAGKEVAVHYNDAQLHSDGHYCKAVYITSGNPPPLR
jgi:hypothetical protein